MTDRQHIEDLIEYRLKRAGETVEDAGLLAKAGHWNLHEKYQKVLNKFCISINWDKTNQDQEKHPLDEIESARARNNLNWMNILRLVLELSPEHGKALVTDIRNIDKEISELTDKLIAS